jgi:hypothetical protein
MTGVEVAPVGLGICKRLQLFTEAGAVFFWRSSRPLQFLAGLGAASQNLRLASLRAFCKPLLDPAIAS